jgi:hypothetical protein
MLLAGYRHLRLFGDFWQPSQHSFSTLFASRFPFDATRNGRQRSAKIQSAAAWIVA